MKVDLRKEGSNIVWRVVDTGKGIPKEEIKQGLQTLLHDKEMQDRFGTSPREGVRQKPGGRHKIHSEEGKGTTVEIMISGGQG
ncbi:MAG: hypothetical protein Q9N34_00825 [Aquificota bacterium]|nr:hypothetical protein [Aquificota bacterium]